MEKNKITSMQCARTPCFRHHSKPLDTSHLILRTTSWDQYYQYPLLSSRKLQLREVKQPAQSHPAGQRQTRVSNLGLPGLRPQLYTWTSDSLTEPSLYHSWYHPWTIPALYLDYLPQPQSHPCTTSVDLWPVSPENIALVVCLEMAAYFCIFLIPCLK